MATAKQTFTYVISYDLLKPGQDYDSLIKELESFPLWWHHLKSTWVVTSSLSTVEVRDKLTPHLDSNDKLLIVKSAGVGAWTGFNKDASDWLEANL